jgi:hypothetical protein
MHSYQVHIIWQLRDNNLAIIDKKKFSKRVNMGSSFEDLITTKLMVKKTFIQISGLRDKTFQFKHGEEFNITTLHAYIFRTRCMGLDLCGATK